MIPLLFLTEEVFDGWRDYLFWQRMDRRVVKRINELIHDTQISESAVSGHCHPQRFSCAAIFRASCSTAYQVMV